MRMKGSPFKEMIAKRNYSLPELTSRLKKKSRFPGNGSRHQIIPYQKKAEKLADRIK
jgi:hypothetical protein